MFYYLLLKRKLHCRYPSRDNRYSQLSRASDCEPFTSNSSTFQFVDCYSTLYIYQESTTQYFEISS